MAQRGVCTGKTLKIRTVRAKKLGEEVDQAGSPRPTLKPKNLRSVEHRVQPSLALFLARSNAHYSGRTGGTRSPTLGAWQQGRMKAQAGRWVMWAFGVPGSAVGTQIPNNSLSQHHGGHLMAPAFPTPSPPPQPLGRVISFRKLKIHSAL